MFSLNISFDLFDDMSRRSLTTYDFYDTDKST